MKPPEVSLSLLSDLNPEQRKAVEQVDGPILILAGAGSGKTRVITYRIAYLIEACSIRPENILAVTFTNKAAEQMKERVRGLLQGSQPANPLICTFHSLCVRILRREIERIGYSRDFAIFDEADQESLMKTCLKEVGLDTKAVTPRGVLAQISSAKNHGITPTQFYAAAATPAREQVAILFELYQKKLKQSNALDFDDLLICAVKLFTEFPEARDVYGERYHYLLVDEYQDTNQIQYQLIRHLTRHRQNLCVVGDEDQSIYRWRGADIQNILSFEEDYPNSTLIKLEQNYRSTQVILDAASAVVANNQARKGKSLWTSRQGGERIIVYEASDAENEALFVTQKVGELRALESSLKCAVLYRTNAQSRSFEEAFRRFAIPYRMVGGFSFYDRAEIKDILSYLKFSLNTEDSVSLERIINTPSRGIGKSTVDTITRLSREEGISLWKAIDLWLQRKTLTDRALSALNGFKRVIESIQEKADALSLPELVRFVTEATGYRQMLGDEDTEESLARLENLNELMNAAADSQERGETLRDFLDHAALVSDQDDYDETAAVSLMTAHSAKGLEFPAVFVAGLEEGLFPHSRSMLVQEDLEEERRLFYVAMTRAQNRLFLSRVRMRRYYGADAANATEASRFLSEIPARLVEDFSDRSPLGKARRIYDGATYDTVEHIQQYLRARTSGGLKNDGKKTESTATAMPDPIKWKSKFQLGAQVRHPKYGVGTVLRSEGSGDGLKLSVNFQRHGLKKLVEKYAGLEEA
jgi:DNA helicase-2/ATP-dependent DNA helicase PcrA